MYVKAEISGALKKFHTGSELRYRHLFRGKTFKSGLSACKVDGDEMQNKPNEQTGTRQGGREKRANAIGIQVNSLSGRAPVGG